jgi:hypothetical protein
MLGILVLAAAVGTALGLLISAVARTSEMAIALLPLAILPLMIFGGALQPPYKMHPALQRACDAFPSRWAFEGVMVLESDRRPTSPLLVARNGSTSTESGAATFDMAELYFPARTDRMGSRAAAFALGGTFAFLVAFIGAVLRFRDLH